MEGRLDEWKKKDKDAEQAGKPQPRIGRWRDSCRQPPPANLYHARVEPVLRYAIRGAIWYQGESNAGRAYQYREMFPLMIKSWREDWKQGDFPFYWVQLADFMAEKPEPGDSAWAELREAQTMTQDKLPNTGQAVIIDIGEGATFTREQARSRPPAGALALARRLRQERRYQSPRYDSMETKDGKIVLKFKDVGGGLRTVDAKDVAGLRDRRRGPEMALGRGEDRARRIRSRFRARKSQSPWPCDTPGPITRCATCTTSRAAGHAVPHGRLAGCDEGNAAVTATERRSRMSTEGGIPPEFWVPAITGSRLCEVVRDRRICRTSFAVPLALLLWRSPVGEQPVVHFRVVVRWRPRVVLDVGIHGEPHVAAGTRTASTISCALRAEPSDPLRRGMPRSARR